jgi:hypothetical protein
LIKWWLTSKARKYSKYFFMLGVPVLLFGFAIQVVVAGVTSHAVDEKMSGNGSKMMNDPNQEVTGGIASVGGVGALGSSMSATSGGHSGASGKGSSADITPLTTVSVQLTAINGDQIKFVYFDIACTGKLTSEALTSLKPLNKVTPGQPLTLTVNKAELERGLKASNGKTANLGSVLLVQNF